MQITDQKKTADRADARAHPSCPEPLKMTQYAGKQKGGCTY